MKDRLRWPGLTGRRALAAAALAWTGAAAGWAWGPRALVASLLGSLLLVSRGRAVYAVVLSGAVLSGTFAAARQDATLGRSITSGHVEVIGRVSDEPRAVGDSIEFLFVPQAASAALRGRPPLAVRVATALGTPSFGDVVGISGVVVPGAGRLRGDPVAGRLEADSLEVLTHTRNPLFAVGNAFRDRVDDRLARGGDPEGSALLRGFLIGDTSGLRPHRVDDLRRAGLSHFVAVSGSNVALFLAGWWLVTAPLFHRPRARAAIGLAGLAIFVVMTRWEPSVVRAAAMAGLVLAGRLAGRPVDTWTALGVAVTGLLLLSGDLAANVGFQLSAVATLGVLAGAGLFRGRRPGLLWAGFAATISAQAAVTPILLAHFGTVPLLSPVANLAALPLVTGATALGGAGVTLGIDGLVEAGAWIARRVLWIAAISAGWPQLGAGSVALLAAVGAAGSRRSLRSVSLVAGIALVVSLLVPASPGSGVRIRFLDVGQGDAVLLLDGGGRVVLVDGGSRPEVLRAGLRRASVSRIDLLVVTHGDEDHAGGLAGLADAREVGAVWVPDQPHLGALLDGVLAGVESRGIPVERLRAGARRRIGAFVLEVIGPGRRYASDNDGSLVLAVHSGGRTALLAGDVEAVAQRDLPPMHPDVLLVPHHGSATTDRRWLESTVGPIAVISVGQNRFGHPAEEVVETLRTAGARILMTRDLGDIVVRLT